MKRAKYDPVTGRRERRRRRRRSLDDRIVLIRRHSRRHSRTLDQTIKAFLGEVTYRLGKIGIIALVGALSNLIIHRYTDSHALNAVGVLVATGAAAAIKTGK